MLDRKNAKPKRKRDFDGVGRSTTGAPSRTQVFYRTLPTLLCSARLERIVIAPVAVLALRFVAERWLAPRFRQVRWDWLLAVLIVIYGIALYAWYWCSLVPQLYGQR